MLQNHQQLAPAVIAAADLTREGNKRVHCIRDLQKSLRNSCFRKQNATLARFMPWYQKIFVLT